MRVSRLLETAIYGEDLDVLTRFYTEFLGLERVADTPGRNVVLRCGPAALILFDPRASSQRDAMFPSHGSTGPGHIAFSVPLREFDPWRQRLAQFNIPIREGDRVA